MSPDPELTIIEVTITKKYVFESNSINGWTNEDVVQDWFGDANINRYHATRDGCHLGGGDHIVSIKINGKTFELKQK